MNMRLFVAVLLFGAAASVTFGQNRPIAKTLLHDGLERRYFLYVPSSSTPESSLPLVVSLHALTRNSSQQMTSSGMNEVAEREGFLVAYPDAVNGDWFGPQDNVGFIDALLDQISSEYSIDASRVYATGLSQGGMMSYILSVERPATFAAIASVSGPRPFDFGRDTDIFYPPDVAVTPNRPFPLLHMHGTGESFFIPYDGGRSPFRPDYVFPPVEQIVNSYVVNNACDTTPTVTDLPDVNETDNSTVQLVSYENCRTYTGSSGDSIAAEVLFYRIEGGGHAWPGGSTGPPGEVINRDINASQVIWNFFSRHQLPIDMLQPKLQAGDADQDLDFDQLDLVQVQVASKYLTGDAATWGEGDWNGAPGGSPGDPPAGDALFNQFDIIAAQQASTYLTGPYAAVQPSGQRGDAQTSVVYDPSTGEVTVDAPSGVELTSINIDSAAGIFTGDAAANLGGSFDNDADGNIFKATFGSSFGSLSFSNVAQAGLSEAFLLADLTVIGSLAGGGDLGDVDLVYVPEPASALLLALGFAIGLLRFRRIGR